MKYLNLVIKNWSAKQLVAKFYSRLRTSLYVGGKKNLEKNMTSVLRLFIDWWILLYTRVCYIHNVTAFLRVWSKDSSGSLPFLGSFRLNCFHDCIKTLSAFCTSIFSKVYSTVSQKLHDMWYCSRLNVEADINSTCLPWSHILVLQKCKIVTVLLYIFLF